MSLSSLINRPCTLRRATSTSGDDGYGNKTRTYTDVATVCELQQFRREESETGELSGTDWRAFFLSTEDMGVNATANKLVVDGNTYEFVGLPWRVWNPRTKLVNHIEASLRVAQ